MDCFAALAMTGKTLPLPRAAHEVEVAAFIGLQDGLVEQMRVAALGPVRSYPRRQCGTAFFQLGCIDQQIDAALGDIEPDHVAVLHQRQRAAVGGPLALVRNGDMIRLDVAKRSIDLLVDVAELEKRRAALALPVTPDWAKRGYAHLFNETILQADEGCDFDFMRGKGKG